jgi:hypothetical protein
VDALGVLRRAAAEVAVLAHMAIISRGFGVKRLIHRGWGCRNYGAYYLVA